MTEEAAVRQLSIGEVLDLLQEEFPDVTISKIRFLESRGLVEPERTSSGYRQFGAGDIDRLRWILRQQRDHFLPLKVIKQMLEAGLEHLPNGASAQPSLFDESGDGRAPGPSSAHPTVAGPGAAPRRRPGAPAAAPRGAAGGTGPGPADLDDGLNDDPEDDLDDVAEVDLGEASGGASPGGAGGRPLSTPADVVAALQEDPRLPRRRPAGPSGPPVPTVDAAMLSNPATGPRRTGEELCTTTGLSPELLEELERFGLVEPVVVAGTKEYGPEAAAVVELALQYVALGVEPRHLRIYKVSAEREAGFVEQLTVPLLKKGTAGARTDAVGRAAELARLGAELHAEILRQRLGPSFRD